jgi:hypothetical protein
MMIRIAQASGNDAADTAEADNSDGFSGGGCGRGRHEAIPCGEKGLRSPHSALRLI